VVCVWFRVSFRVRVEDKAPCTHFYLIGLAPELSRSGCQLTK
jgi:hypothetical protein